MMENEVNNRLTLRSDVVKWRGNKGYILVSLLEKMKFAYSWNGDVLELISKKTGDYKIFYRQLPRYYTDGIASIEILVVENYDNNIK